VEASQWRMRTKLDESTNGKPASDTRASI
jgi:hypothetical protein